MNKIIWEKWVDPFGENLEETKWNNYDNETQDQDAEVFDNALSESSKINRSVKVIASPMGLIPYNEYTASGKIFNFWVGHTNFNITEKIAKLIETIPGIELLDVFTRYRFRVAIGKCFNDSDVMSTISEAIKLLDKIV